MAINKKKGLFPVDIKAEGYLSLYDVTRPFISFNHRDLISRKDSSPTLHRKKLINAINHINFTGGSVFIHLRENDYGDDVYVSSFPAPCIDGTITCYWPENFSFTDGRYEFQNLIILDGLSVILAPVSPEDVADDHFTAPIPEKGYVLGRRSTRRYYCRNIKAELVQNGFVAEGLLIDFSGEAFRIDISPSPPASFHWFNEDGPATVILSREGTSIFTGLCRCIRCTRETAKKECVLSPVSSEIKRFQKKKARGSRMKLTPTPNISFDHPFFQKTISRKIKDLSVTGFSVYETAEESVLMPGMIIPGLSIIFSGDTVARCTAQVIYRKLEKKGLLRCGLAILDMDVTMFGRMSNVLFNVTDPNVFVDHKVDMEALWEFFFDTNFIYPKKYRHIHSYRSDFKETYRKLYSNNPDIAANITYQKDGKIHGHVSMVKAYERAWMIHHLAARPAGGKQIGLSMLKQIIYYFEGFYRLPSLNMDYWICYFRPENRFMDYFFRSFVQHLDNPRACSLDLFAYKDYPTDSAGGKTLPAEWTLREFSKAESPELHRYYRNASGGLYLDTVLPDHLPDGESLEELYARNGFVRRMNAFSLLRMDKLKALLVVNESNLGLNLSELLNGITIIINDSDGLTWDILTDALDHLVSVYDSPVVPLLVYPHTYLEERKIDYEKKYQMLIMDMQHGKDFIYFMQQQLKTKIRFLLKYLIRKYMKK